ncbi:MAG: S1 RNA-binding domain-containing protein, partial [Bacteroidetes bacterium]|nr:S1 RNA-binding domain-containing protein [Bacteroidota bacterium]
PIYDEWERSCGECPVNRFLDGQEGIPLVHQDPIRYLTIRPIKHIFFSIKSLTSVFYINSRIMKPPLYFVPLLFVFLSASGCTGSGILENLITGEDIITSVQMKQHISFLASDSMMGRDTPSSQLDSAAAHIAAVFKSSGLQPVNGSYFDKVGMGIIKLGDDNHLKILKSQSEKSYQIKSEFTPFDLTGDGEVTAPVIFAGYGITAPDYNYDDYKGIDVEGKIVRIIEKGVIVELPLGVDGFVPLSQLSQTPVKNVADSFKVGDAISLKVIEFDKESKKIVLSAIEFLSGKEQKVVDDYVSSHRLTPMTMKDVFSAPPAEGDAPQN